MNRYSKQWIGVFLGWVFALDVVANIEKLEQIYKKDGAQAAYAYGLSIEDQYAGNEKFDLLFARIAIVADKAETAIFTLEALLTSNPANTAARMELARAYYLTGNYEEALIQFRTLEAGQPSAEDMVTIEGYIAEISRKVQPTTLSLTPHVAIQFGVDSNTNSATSASTILVPFIGQLTLNSTSQGLDDPFTQLETGILGQYPFSPDIKGFVDLKAQYRFNEFNREFNTGYLTGLTGVDINKGKHNIKIPLGYQQTYLNGFPYLDFYNAGLQWTYHQTTERQYFVFGQAGSLRYPDIKLQNAHLYIGGAGISQRLTDVPVTLGFSGFYGQEHTTEPNTEFNSRMLYGAQGSAQWVFVPKHTAYLNLLWQRSDYDAVHPTFGLVREENYDSAGLGWYWQQTPKLSVMLEMNYIRNDSDITFYTYDRWLSYFQIRRDF